MYGAERVAAPRARRSGGIDLYKKREQGAIEDQRKRKRRMLRLKEGRKDGLRAYLSARIVA
jgi:hypothetical protein